MSGRIELDRAVAEDALAALQWARAVPEVIGSRARQAWAEQRRRASDALEVALAHDEGSQHRTVASDPAGLGRRPRDVQGAGRGQAGAVVSDPRIERLATAIEKAHMDWINSTRILSPDVHGHLAAALVADGWVQAAEVAADPTPQRIVEALCRVADWCGAADWTGPQLPDDLARELADLLPPRWTDSQVAAIEQRFNLPGRP